MKYKIIAIKYAEPHNKEFLVIDSDSKYIPTNSDAWVKFRVDDWASLNLYGVHIFETDDLESFDLLEAQKQKDEVVLKESNSDFPSRLSPNTGTYADGFKEGYNRFIVDNRKAEIRRIAEQLFIHQGHIINDRELIKIAIDYVDNFESKIDAEFEKLEGKK